MATATELVPSEKLQWYRQMALIRAFEEAAVQLFGEGLITGSTHPCIAQEATCVGVCAALEAKDLVLATYRGHGVASLREATRELYWPNC